MKVNNGLFIQQFELLDRWNIPVAIPINTDDKEKNEMYATVESYEEKYGKNEKYEIKSILEMLKKVRDNKTELSIYGILPFTVDVTYEDIQLLEPELSGIISLVEYMKEEISEEELIEKIGEIPIIFTGEYPDIEKGGYFGVHTVKHIKEDYEMIPVFLNKKNVEEYNKGNHPTTETTIKELRNFYSKYGIIVEPQKEYWAVIKPEVI